MYTSIIKIIRWGFALVVLLMISGGIFLFLDIGVAALQGGAPATASQLDTYSFGLVLLTSLLAVGIVFIGVIPPILDILTTWIKQREETDIFP